MLCEDTKNKFNCTCAVEYYGRFCQKRRATSCKEQLQKNRGSRSRVYQLFDPTTISLYEVFCDANSEKGFVWTLIESFSRRSKKVFANKPFYKGYPITQDAFTWSEFGLSLPRMIVTANRSTHVRATCNFNTEELQYRDYFRAKLSDAKNTNLLASEDIIVLTAPLTSSKGIFGMRILIRIGLHR